MWPFSSRGSAAKTTAPQPADLPELADFKRNDVALKVWLPQLLVDRVNWLSVQKGVSRPDLVRTFIFINLYGNVAYESLCAQYRRREGRDQIDDGSSSSENDIRKSRDRTTAVDLREIGKSDEDITIALPSKLKSDLTEVAKLHGLDASSYVRKLLVLELLGEKVHSRWQHAIGKLSPDLRLLERD